MRNVWIPSTSNGSSRKAPRRNCYCYAICFTICSFAISLNWHHREEEAVLYHNYGWHYHAHSSLYYDGIFFIIFVKRGNAALKVRKLNGNEEVYLHAFAGLCGVIVGGNDHTVYDVVPCIRVFHELECSKSTIWVLASDRITVSFSLWRVITIVSPTTFGALTCIYNTTRSISNTIIILHEQNTSW